MHRTNLKGVNFGSSASKTHKTCVTGCPKLAFFPPVLHVNVNHLSIFLLISQVTLHKLFFKWPFLRYRVLGFNLGNFVCEQQHLFLRKTALLLNTTNSLPGNMFTVLPSDMTSFPELSFQFESLDEVNNYWTQLQSIALHTDLNNISGTVLFIHLSIFSSPF